MIVRISILDTIINLYKPRILGQLYQICIKITIFNILRRNKNKERAKSQRLSSFFELPWKDSNPHRRNQNPTCYHYTTRQGVCHLPLSVIDGAKVGGFFELTKYFSNFFIRFFHLHESMAVKATV